MSLSPFFSVQCVSHHLSSSLQLLNVVFLLPCFFQVGDQHISTTTCGYPCWAHCCVVLSCLLSTGGLLYSHMPLKSSSTFMSQSRSQVSCAYMFAYLEVHSRCLHELTCEDSYFLSRCELGLVHAGGDICESSRQRSVSVWCRGSCQELQVKVRIASVWLQIYISKQCNTTRANVSLTV